MGDKTGISWTDATWNPVRGCSRVSPGCEHCYAERSAHRMNHPGGAYEGLTLMTSRGPVWSGTVRTVPPLLGQPVRWRKPRKVFVNSMSDLFHEDVPFDFLVDVFAVMRYASEHTFQVLTKRPEVMLDRVPRVMRKLNMREPLRNVWLGVSVEDQKALEERLPKLASVWCAVPWLSCEPLLGPLDFGPMLLEWGIRWAVFGGESGPGARPCDVQWIRDAVRQCREAGVAVWVKQLGANAVEHCDHYPGRGQRRRSGEERCQLCYETDRRHVPLSDAKGGNPLEWSHDLRVQEFPA